MSVLLQAKLEVSLKDSSASASLDDFCNDICDAFQSNKPEIIDLPGSLESVFQRQAFTKQHLDGGADLYLIAPAEPQSDSPNAGFNILVYTYEEKPEAADCISALNRRIKKARKRARRLKKIDIKTPRTFYVYPLTDAGPDMRDDGPFYFLFECQGLSRANVQVTIYWLSAAFVSFIVGSLLPADGIFDFIGSLLKNLLAGGFIGVALTLLYECIRDVGQPRIDLNDAVNRDTKHKANNRTEQVIDTYRGTTETLKHTKKKDGINEH